MSSSRWIVTSSCPYEDNLVSSCNGDCEECEYDGYDELESYLKEKNNE